MVEIKNVRLVSFTLMTASIQAIFAFIIAIIFVIGLATFAGFIPFLAPVASSLAVLGIAAIIAFPILTFISNVSTNFISAGLYNLLVPKVGGIKLEMEGDEVKSIPVVSLALITSCIMAIWAFIIGLILALGVTAFSAIMGSLINIMAPIIANATNATTAAVLPTGAALGAGGAVTALILIIGLPIMVFIIGFIGNALFAIFYNVIATKVAKIKLEFAGVTETLNELKSIPVVPAALSIAVVTLIFGLIIGIINLITYSATGNATAGVMLLIGDIIGYFIGYFIIVALMAIFYNFLAPRIGGVKLELE